MAKTKKRPLSKTKRLIQSWPFHSIWMEPEVYHAHSLYWDKQTNSKFKIRTPQGHYYEAIWQNVEAGLFSVLTPQGVTTAFEITNLKFQPCQMANLQQFPKQ